MKKNLPIIIGIALPLVFILVISIIIFLPTASINPEHNFIYSNESTYYAPNQYSTTYSVSNSGKIVATQNVIEKIDGVPVYKAITPVLYIYDVKNDSSHQLSFEEANKYNLDPGPTSVDGYLIEYRYNNDGIFELFGSNPDQNGYFITKGNGQKKLAGLARDQYYGPGNFKFIGWIK